MECGFPLLFLTVQVVHGNFEKSNKSLVGVTKNFQSSQLRLFQAEGPGSTELPSTDGSIPAAGPSLILNSFFHTRPKSKAQGKLKRNSTTLKFNHTDPLAGKFGASGNVTNSAHPIPGPLDPVYKGNGIPFADARRTYLPEKESDYEDLNSYESETSPYPSQNVMNEIQIVRPMNDRRRKLFPPFQIRPTYRGSHEQSGSSRIPLRDDSSEDVNEYWDPDDQMIQMIMDEYDADLYNDEEPYSAGDESLGKFHRKHNLDFEPAEASEHPYWTMKLGGWNPSSSPENGHNYYEYYGNRPQYGSERKQVRHFPWFWYSDSPQPSSYELEDFYSRRDPLRTASGAERINNLSQDQSRRHPMLQTAKNLVVSNRGQAVGARGVSSHGKQLDEMDKLYLKYVKRKLRGRDSVSVPTMYVPPTSQTSGRKPTLQLKLHIFPNSEESGRRTGGGGNVVGMDRTPWADSDYNRNSPIAFRKYNLAKYRNRATLQPRSRRYNNFASKRPTKYSDGGRATVTRWHLPNKGTYWQKETKPSDNSVILHLHLHNKRKRNNIPTTEWIGD